MQNITITRAIKRIKGRITEDGKGVVYYDDATQKYYLAPIEDIAYLQQLMDSDDRDLSRDAYSHWCAGTSHPQCDEDGNLTSCFDEELLPGKKLGKESLQARDWYDRNIEDKE